MQVQLMDQRNDGLTLQLVQFHEKKRGARTNTLKTIYFE